MFINSKKASKVLGLYPNTLRKMANDNKIKHYKMESRQRRYDVDDYLGTKNGIKTICYYRVSSHKQKDDLQRQIEGGLNYKRKGLQSILRQAMSGKTIKLVSAHKDRITRFGIELIVLVIEKNGGKFMVLNQDTLSPE